MATKSLPPNDPIESIFFYRSFLCWIDRRGNWRVRCTDYGYTYPGEGGAVEAKKKVDYFLNLRYGKADQEQS